MNVYNLQELLHVVGILKAKSRLDPFLFFQQVNSVNNVP